MRCLYRPFHGRYYIEVFSRRYYKQFGEVGVVVRDSNFDAPISPSSAQAKPPIAPGPPSDTPSAPGSVPPPLVSDQEDEYGDPDDDQAEQAAAEEAELVERASSDSSVASRSGEVGLRTVRHRRTTSSVSAGIKPLSPRVPVDSAADH